MISLSLPFFLTMYMYMYMYVYMYMYMIYMYMMHMYMMYMYIYVYVSILSIYLSSIYSDMVYPHLCICRVRGHIPISPVLHAVRTSCPLRNLFNKIT